MHTIEQLTGLVLLCTAARASQPATITPPVPSPQGYQDLLSIPPIIWANHDWVPEKNRASDARNIPVGGGELDPVPALINRRMSKKAHKQRNHGKSGRSQMHNKHLDLHNLHKFNNLKRIRKGHVEKLKMHARKHRKQPKGQFRRMFQNSRKSKKAVSMLPKDFLEEVNFRKPNSDICAQNILKPHQQYLLLPWTYYYCLKHREKQENKDDHRKTVHMHVVKHVLETVKAYKKQEEAAKLQQSLKTQRGGPKK